MLLSSLNATTWAPRVKCIIFDEIHSIGHTEDGLVWEQLLLLAPCRIIALSATVGNPSEFADWLQSTQNNMGVTLKLIQHTQRYSDLRKYS
jgi:superfamily II RNA helicase